MARYNIGIDTGGTYTDAVIVDLPERRIVASAKAVTTHGDLSLGVSEALRKVLADTAKTVAHSDIGLVSVSTTLATNAIVEGRGAPVAVVLIGFDDEMAERSRVSEEVPAERVIRISGGHDHAGREKTPLDENELRSQVGRLKDRVSAFAIASLYSVRNAAHEHRAQSIVQELTELPVSLSCDLSSDLDVPRRALTATLNAQIISRIVALITAIRKSLHEENISARLMVVKGDGSLVPADIIVERPIETIMSGPAASVIGARYLAKEKDFVIADIGGTTTDIATAHNGWPDVSAEGSRIGGYRTMVHAIDMQTEGLGGDSEVLTDHRGSLFLSKTRVASLAWLGSRWPQVTEQIKDALVSGRGLRTVCRFVILPEGMCTDSLPADLDDKDRELIDAVGDSAIPWSSLATRKSDEQRILRLASRGLLQLGGFTPTDAAHVLGMQSQWSVETARLACLALGRTSGLIAESLDDKATIQRVAETVIEAVTQQSTYLLLQHLARTDFAEQDSLIAAVTSGKPLIANLDVRLVSRLPLIAVGGPAALFYPEVGRRLGTSTIIPEGAEVANAIGAAVGMIRIVQTVEITAEKPGRCLVHADDEPLAMNSATEAIEAAQQIAIKRARDAVEAMGATDLQIDTDIQSIELPTSYNHDELISATITAVCTGRLG